MAQNKQEVSFRISAENASKRAFDEVKRSMGEIEAASTKLTNTLAGFGVGLSVAGFATFVKSGIDAADELNKLSQKVGVTVESLSALQYAAKLSGVSNEQLSTGLARLARTATEAQAGTKEAADAFGELGVSVATSSGKLKGTEDLLLDVSESFASMEDGATKTAVAMKIFGRAGAELIPFLNQGRSGFDGLRREAQRLGIVMSSETAKAAEEFNDNLTRLGQASEKLKIVIASSLLPSLTSLTNELVSATKGGDGLLTTLNAVITLETGKFGVSTVAQIENIDKALQDLDRTKKLFRGAAITEPLLGIRESNLLQLQSLVKSRAVQEQLDADLRAIKNLPFQDDTPIGSGNVIRPNAPAPASNRERDSRFQNAIKQLEQEMLKVEELTRFEEVRARILAGHYGKLTPLQQQRLEQLAAESDLKKEDARIQKEADAVVEESVKRQVEALNREDERLRSLRESYIDLVDPIEKFRKKLLEVDELLEKGLISGDAAQAARLIIDDQMQAALGMGDALQKSLKDTDDVARDLGLTFSSAFEDAIVGGKKFSEILKGLEADLLRIATRKLVTEPLADAVSEFFKDSGGMGGLLGALGGLFGGGKAGGGPVSAGTPYLVGERGPELFVPRSSGTVVPNGKSAGQVISVTNHFTISGPIDRRSQDQIAAEAGRGVQRALSRNS